LAKLREKIEELEEYEKFFDLEARFASLTLITSILYLLIVFVFVGHDINIPFITTRSAQAPFKINIWFLVKVLAMAPITEELIFRGSIIALKNKSKILIISVIGAAIFYEAYAFPDLFLIFFISLPLISLIAGLLRLKRYRNYWKFLTAILLLCWPIAHRYELFATLSLFSLGGALMFTGLRRKSIIFPICYHFIGNLSVIIIRTFLIR